MEKYKSPITGHLDIWSAEHEEDDEFGKRQWKEVMIYGNPEGLRSFANFLLTIADLDQNTIKGLPYDERYHHHLYSDHDLSASSENVIVGRLDGKDTGEPYARYVPRKHKD